MVVIKPCLFCLVEDNSVSGISNEDFNRITFVQAYDFSEIASVKDLKSIKEHHNDEPVKAAERNAFKTVDRGFEERIAPIAYVSKRTKRKLHAFIERHSQPLFTPVRVTSQVGSFIKDLDDVRVLVVVGQRQVVVY